MNKLPIGETESLDGYQLIRFLGSGGFGEVWLCRSQAMGDFRAMKWIPATNESRLEKEYAALLNYRKAAAALRSPSLVSIEHVGRTEAGLYYIMPLADGLHSDDPTDPQWTPLSLAGKLCAQADQASWFSSSQIIEMMTPVLDGLQTLSDAGLVHRDVKPDNILFFNDKPCLGDISLLGEDTAAITRHGTVGYIAPSWYKMGHPDMYGAAATLYSVLTGHVPDRMGRSAFLWPPQGEDSLSTEEKAEWKRLHQVVRRATEEKVSERYLDYQTMSKAMADSAFATAKKSLKKGKIVMIGLAIVALTILAFPEIYKGAPPEQTDTATPAEEPPPKLPELTPEEKADYAAMAGMVEGYLGDGEYANALATVEQLLATYPQSRTHPGYSVARAMALQGLGKIDEAKRELEKEINISPQIAAAALRKDLWESLGDLPGAENDITRILDKFGPNSLMLYLRADVRAKQNDYAGVQADREAAYAANPKELEQRRMVDVMWKPLETKYPGYAAYLKRHVSPDSEGTLKGMGVEHDDAWVLEVFDVIMSDIAEPNRTYSESAMKSRRHTSTASREAFESLDFATALLHLDRVTDSIPTLGKTPVLSLYRALLLKRLDRERETNAELTKLCHRDESTRLIDARICLLNALDRRREAEELLGRMLEPLLGENEATAQNRITLLRLRARIRAIRGNLPGVREDYNEAIDLAARHSIEKESVEATWNTLATQYPAYAAYLESLLEK